MTAVTSHVPTGPYVADASVNVAPTPRSPVRNAASESHLPSAARSPALSAAVKVADSVVEQPSSRRPAASAGTSNPADVRAWAASRKICSERLAATLKLAQLTVPEQSRVEPLGVCSTALPFISLTLLPSPWNTQAVELIRVTLATRSVSSTSWPNS